MEAPTVPGQEAPSSKSYATAVIMSSVVGWVGGHHFYLGRWREGLLDLGLTIGWIYCFATDKWIFGIVFLIADLAHALVVTIMLLTGNFRDGEGRRVCYPGQQLTSRRS
jgi:TM2 domain-containing membrane protein YozV